MDTMDFVSAKGVKHNRCFRLLYTRKLGDHKMRQNGLQTELASQLNLAI